MLTLKLAFRGLWRHKVRTLLTLSAVVFGLLLLQVFVALNDGGHEQMVEIGVRQGSAGHVVVQAEGYQAERALEYTVQDGAAVRRAVTSRLPAAKVVLRTFGGGLARTSHDSTGVIFSGVEPARERHVSGIAAAIQRGVYLDANTTVGARQATEKELWCVHPPRPGEPPVRRAVIGTQMARTLKLGLCDKLVLDAQGMGAQESAQLRVVGIFRTGNSDLDGSFVIVPLADSQRILHLGQAVHQVAVFVKDSLAAPAATRAVRAALADHPGLEILPWDRALPELAEFIWFDDASMWVFNIILLVIIGIGVLNTILMSVMERTREIGVMRGIGMSGRTVVGLVMTEAALIGLLGTALGWALAAPLVHYFSTTGIDLAALTGADAEIGGVTISVMKAKLYPARALLGTGIVLGMALLAGIYPAVRAARLRVLRAIHHV